MGDYTAAGIRYVVEVSNDLLTWTAAGSAVTQVSITSNADGVSETVVVRLVAPTVPGDAHRFLRLKANRP